MFHLQSPATAHMVPRPLRVHTYIKGDELVAIPERLVPLRGYFADGGDLADKLGGAKLTKVVTLYEPAGLFAPSALTHVLNATCFKGFPSD